VLLDRCPTCQAPLEPHRLDVRDGSHVLCDTCKRDLRAASGDLAATADPATTTPPLNRSISMTDPSTSLDAATHRHDRVSSPEQMAPLIFTYTHVITSYGYRIGYHR